MKITTCWRTGPMSYAPVTMVAENVELKITPELGDADLLERFLVHRDEVAFASLVRRHSSTVWSVCRRVLPREQDAEDAFQAVFIVLARKAASIRKREAVGSWLYGVAYRIAMRAKRTGNRRQQREKQGERSGKIESPAGAASLRELHEILDEEIQRLGENY